MKQPRKPYTDRSLWTPEQIAIVQRLIEVSQRIRSIVKWADHVEEIGHPLSSIKSMAHYQRCRLSKQRYRADNKILRERAKQKALTEKPVAAPDYPGHLTLTPKCRLVFDQELRDRIRERGLTAGFFGDPMPGRSALDELRAGIVRPAAPTQGVHPPARKPTLATRALP